MTKEPTPPHKVSSPAERLKGAEIKVVRDGPFWSMAYGMWDGTRALLIRYNGDADNPLGSPSSHAWATWFVLPSELNEDALKRSSNELGREAALRWLRCED